MKTRKPDPKTQRKQAIRLMRKFKHSFRFVREDSSARFAEACRP